MLGACDCAKSTDFAAVAAAAAPAAAVAAVLNTFVCAKSDNFAAGAAAAVLTTCDFAKRDNFAAVTAAAAAAATAVWLTDALAMTCQGPAVAVLVAGTVDWKPKGPLVAHLRHLLLRHHTGLEVQTAY